KRQLLSTACSSKIIQPSSEEILAGGDVNLTCDHPTLTTNEYVHWYKLQFGQRPLFLIQGYQKTETHNQYIMVFKEDRKSSVLVLQNVRPEQSAEYLCASSDTMLQVKSQLVQNVI
uniref:Ig-like domain-containing protein n=1 Tax=Leptobrachium leishanense TaxID=445787 RepID=A0A8C5M8F9_9ANUR